MSSSTRRRLLERVTRKGVLARWFRFARRDVWHVDVSDLSRRRARLTRLLRVVIIAGRGFQRHRCLQQAAVLTYLTIFSLPVLLAMVFSIARGLNAYQHLRDGPIEAFLEDAFPADSGEGSVQIRAVVDQIFDYVENADLSVLTWVGVLFLLYATIKMLGAVERSFNEIWGVHQPRSLVRKFSDYLAIVVVTPLALIVGTGFTAFLQGKQIMQEEGQEVTGEVLQSPVATALLAAVPLITMCVGMTIVLMTLPNTRVRLSAALFGGVIAGIAWQGVQIGFVEFQIGLTRLNAIYSSFAAVPLLLTWIYLSWTTLFVGTELSYAFQNEDVITSLARTGPVDQRFREALAPRLAGRLTAAFQAGEPAPTAAQLAYEIGVAPRAALDVLEALIDHGLLVRTRGEEDDGFVPGRDPDSITVLDLLLALRREEGVNPVPAPGRLDQRVDRILAAFQEELSGSLSNYTLTELARVTTEEGAEGEELVGDGETAPASSS